MKRFVLIALLLTAWVVPAAAQNEKIDHRLLVERDGRMYLKFSDVPYTGSTTGQKQLNYQDGKLNGQQLIFRDNGQLAERKNYRDGILHGAAKIYYPNGQLKWQRRFNNGVEHGVAKIFTKTAS